MPISEVLQCDNFLLETKHCTSIKSILIIEDLSSLAQHIQQSLIQEFDIEIEIAGTEKEAIEVLENRSFDLIIVDIVLPDSSGNFIGKLIRDKNRIIVMTARENEVEREKLVSLPILDYIYKTDEKTIVSYLINEIIRLQKNTNTVVAVCDDAKLSRLQITQMLQQQNLAYYEFEDGQQAYECIIQEGLKVDCIITDLHMPHMDGMDLIRYIRHDHTFNELPILALSASDKSSTVAQLLKIGANDYVSKPIRKEEFIVRLNASLDQSRLYRENISLIDELKMAATIDFLTKLYNRNFFYNSVKHIQAQGKREGSKYGIVMIDIDYFKQVNDNYGHEAGDLTLKRVANVIKNSVRASDIACRWGGEEFLILVPKSNLTELVQFSERLRQRIESSEIIIDPLMLKFSVTASFGVTVENEDNIEVAISRADKYLYNVKESGRNAVGYK